MFNKIDLSPDFQAPATNSENIFVSAKEGTNIDCLIEKIKERIFGSKDAGESAHPFFTGDLVSFLCEKTEVLSMNYVEEGTRFEAGNKSGGYQRLKAYEII